MTNNSVHFSSKKQDWGTPITLFNSLNSVYGFELDAAASHFNHLCDNYFTEDEDSLQQDWTKFSSVFVNPPYGRMGPKFIRKAYEEALRSGGATSVVMLVPARPDTLVWHECIFNKDTQVGFLKGRVKFVGASAGAPFPSAVLVFGSDIPLRSVDIPMAVVSLD